MKEEKYQGLCPHWSSCWCNNTEIPHSTILSLSKLSLESHYNHCIAVAGEFSSSSSYFQEKQEKVLDISTKKKVLDTKIKKKKVLVCQ